MIAPATAEMISEASEIAARAFRDADSCNADLSEIITEFFCANTQIGTLMTMVIGGKQYRHAARTKFTGDWRPAAAENGRNLAHWAALKVWAQPE